MVAVKKKQPGPEIFRYDLGAVRMWREDLAELVNVLNDSLDKPLDLESGGYTLDRVEDLADVQEKTVPYFAAWLHADGEAGAYSRRVHRVYLILERNKCTLEMRDPDNGMRWAASEAIRIAKRCRRRFAWLIRHAPFIFLGLATLSTMVFAVIIAALGLQGKVSLTATLAVPTPFAFAAAISALARPHRIPWAVLCTRTRPEAPNFWNRKRDDIWITVVSNVISLILGAWLGYYLSSRS
ncbi:hypothetical protein HC028_18490 [Planosporangium flavigriseum]|nr:hypothetical protein [Planosporangium flavigriseum]NJC66477.1 hypothetical protein [Planosporangium flavigriseum]